MAPDKNSHSYYLISQNIISQKFIYNFCIRVASANFKLNLLSSNYFIFPAFLTFIFSYIARIGLKFYRVKLAGADCWLLISVRTSEHYSDQVIRRELSLSDTLYSVVVFCVVVYSWLFLFGVKLW